jgi:hypothetical protein
MAVSVTDRLKMELWRRYGTEAWPAEWDGNVYGGGKLSQRFWEYFKAIELMDLRDDSVVLDIGGGSPATGLGFFMDIIASKVRRVLILDPNTAQARNDNPRVTLLAMDATRESLTRVLLENSDITHISTISVLEHVTPEIRKGWFEAINQDFKGDSLVMTLEYHTKRIFFEHQLTVRTLSEMVAPLSRFYLDAFEASPVINESSLDEVHTVVAKRRKWFSPHLRLATLFVPRWIPVVLRFRKAV